MTKKIPISVILNICLGLILVLVLRRIRNKCTTTKNTLKETLKEKEKKLKEKTKELKEMEINYANAKSYINQIEEEYKYLYRDFLKYELFFEHFTGDNNLMGTKYYTTFYGHDFINYGLRSFYTNTSGFKKLDKEYLKVLMRKRGDTYLYMTIKLPEKQEDMDKIYNDMLKRMKENDNIIEGKRKRYRIK